MPLRIRPAGRMRITAQVTPEEADDVYPVPEEVSPEEVSPGGTQFVYVQDDMGYDDDYIDGIDLVGGAEDVMRASNIRPDSNKEALIVAVEDGEVVGAVYYGIVNSEFGHEASFDVAVTPEYRGRIGMDLIRRAVEYAENDLAEIGGHIRLWVVNPRLVPILERRFGFDIDSQYSDGSAHMIKYQGN